jgi:hypothetical protein
MDDEVRPQINKLRVIEEASLNGGFDDLASLHEDKFQGFINGLHEIILDATSAFDNVRKELDRIHAEEKRGGR